MNACRTCSTCRPCARCSASCAAAPCAWSASTPPRPRRSPRACCSTGSPRTCTRATRRWPNAAPRRCRSIAICCATCSAPKSCASCSIPACWPTSSWSCSAWPTAAGHAAPTSCTTCSARSATSPSPRSICAAKARRGVDRRARSYAPRDRGPVGWRVAVGRRRRRGQVPRRLRMQLAARPAAGVHRAGRPSRSSRWSPATPARMARSPRPMSPIVSQRRSSASSARSLRLEADGRVVHGEFRPGGVGREYCDADVLRQLRRRSLAMLRREVEPVEPEAYARFIQAWHGIPGERRGLDSLVEALAQLQGAAVVASVAGDRAAAGPPA